MCKTGYLGEITRILLSCTGKRIFSHIILFVLIAETLYMCFAKYANRSHMTFSRGILVIYYRE